MDEEQPEPKISLPIRILVGIIFFVFDAIGYVLFFFGLDDFWLIDAAASPIFFYLFLKGVPPMRQLIGNIIELVPWLGGILPGYSIGWALTCWMDSHQNSAAAQALGSMASVAGGKGGVAPQGVMKGAKGEVRLATQEARGGARVPSREVVTTGQGGGSAQGSEGNRQWEGNTQHIDRGGMKDQSLASMLGEKENEYERLDAKLYPKQLEDIPRMASTNDDDDVEVGDDGVVDLRGTR